MDITELIKQASQDFDKLTQERHQVGQKEYGEFTFLGNDVIRMMQEELADTANYARYHFIKLAIIQGMMLADEESKEVAESFGIGTFQGVGDVGWNK